MLSDGAPKVQSALYRIAELASAAKNMQDFYGAVHAVVGELMYADNFFIALFDEERQLINWPYWEDELDVDWPAANAWVDFDSRRRVGPPPTSSERANRNGFRGGKKELRLRRASSSSGAR